MRFMLIVKANADTETGSMPSRELIEEMGRYNEELMKAGVLLAADGLQRLGGALGGRSLIPHPRRRRSTTS